MKKFALTFSSALLVVLAVVPAAIAATPELTVKPPTITKSPNATFEFSYAGASGFSCTLDGLGPETCSSPFVAEKLADGSHTFSVYANYFESVQTCFPAPVGCINLPVARVSDPIDYTFNVDTVAPVITFAGGPAPKARTKNKSVTYTFAADAGSTLTCSLDSRPLTTCGSPLRLSNLRVGMHKLSITSVDLALNAGLPAVRYIARYSKNRTFAYVGSTRYRDCTIRKKKSGRVVKKCRTKQLP